MTSETAKTWPVGEGPEWFWAIVDRFGLGNVPSDEVAALRLLCDKAERYDALASTAGAGAGDWVTVPRKITMPMGMKFYEHRARDEDAQFCWEAMIEAAPAVPASPRSGAGEGKAFSKIRAGLEDALAFANGDTSRAELRTFIVKDGQACEVPASPPTPAEHGVEIRERVEAILRDQIVLRTFHGGYSFMEGFEQAAEAVISALSQGGGAGRSEKGEGEWSAFSAVEIVRRTRCMADETRDAVVWRDCCDLILERLGEDASPAPAQSPSTSDAEG